MNRSIHFLSTSRAAPTLLLATRYLRNVSAQVSPARHGAGQGMMQDGEHACQIRRWWRSSLSYRSFLFQFIKELVQRLQLATFPFGTFHLIECPVQ